MPGVKEQDIITAIWQRSYDDKNKGNLTLCYVLKTLLGDTPIEQYCIKG